MRETCRGPKEWTTHHRKPRSKGGTNDPKNLSIVEKKQHEAWHILFWNLPPHEVARIINEHWIDPEWLLVVVPRGKEGV